MKLDMSDAAAVAVVVASAIGFYFVGRFHEDYLNEKRANAAQAEPLVEPAVDAEQA